MVFWSTLRKKIKDAIQRREFEDLKNQVDDKANTSDVVLKSMSANTTITNTGNTIVSAPIVNLTSRSGDLELRVDNTTKSITCGGARIVNVESPRVANGVATKGYVDTAVSSKANAADVYLKSQTYTRSEIDNKDSTINNRFNSYYTRSEADNKFAYLTTLDSRLGNYYTKSEANNRYYTKSEIDVMHKFSVYNTNGNIRHKMNLGEGAYLYSVETDSVPSSTANVWLETIEIQRDSGGSFYIYTPTQFVSSRRRYYFISNDTYTLNQRLNKVNIVYFNPGR